MESNDIALPMLYAEKARDGRPLMLVQVDAAERPDVQAIAGAVRAGEAGPVLRADATALPGAVVLVWQGSGAAPFSLVFDTPAKLGALRAASGGQVILTWARRGVGSAETRRQSFTLDLPGLDEVLASAEGSQDA